MPAPPLAQVPTQKYLSDDVRISIDPPINLSPDLLFIIMDYLDIETGYQLALYLEDEKFLEQYCGSNYNNFKSSALEILETRQSTAWLINKLNTVVKEQVEAKKELHRKAEKKCIRNYLLGLAGSCLVVGSSIYGLIVGTEERSFSIIFPSGFGMCIGAPSLFSSIICLLTLEPFRGSDVLHGSFFLLLPLLIDESENASRAKSIIKHVASENTNLSINNIQAKLEKFDINTLFKFGKDCILFRAPTRENTTIEVNTPAYKNYKAPFS